MRRQQLSKWRRLASLAGSTLAFVLGTAVGAEAQALKDLQTPDTPLVLKAQGSFFVGGEKSDQTEVELGNLGPGGRITVNQMYVRYMVPQGGDGNVPVVMIHGATLTGKSWETTPDGRMGWDEYLRVVPPEGQFSRIAKSSKKPFDFVSVVSVKSNVLSMPRTPRR